MLIFIIIVAVLGIAAAVVCYLGKFKLAGSIALAATILVITAAVVIAGIKIVDSTEIGVVRRFGDISGTIESGLNLVNPICDSVTIYDLKVHIQELSFASYTKDAQPIDVVADVQYELDRSRIIEIATNYGSYETMEAKLAKSLEENIKSVLARYSAMPLLENRSNLSSEIYEYTLDLENQYPIFMKSATIRNIDFSDAFEASVEAKMTAEQDALRAEEEARRAIIEAERDRDVAEIEAEEKIAQAKGEADAAVVKAQGEADALDITREALEGMPENWIMQQYLEKWNGELPKYMLGTGTNVMLTPDMTE